MTTGLVLPVLLTAFWCPAAITSAEELSDALKSVAHKIVYETWQEDNWELFMVGADGSHPVNLTRTPKINELYPHVSPQGTKVCFSVDEGEGAAKVRNVYYMNLDGSGRTLVARNARQACWRPDGNAIAYLKGEAEQFSSKDYATRGIFFYDLATGSHRQHSNRDLHHLYNIGYSPDGRWLVATVHAGMGFGHAILAIEAEGPKVVDLQLPGCRPEISPDGKQLAWGAGDYTLRVADLDLGGPEPKVSNPRDVVRSEKPVMIYHFDWSPDGKYLAFCRGEAKKRLGGHPAVVGAKAEGWNLCVADAAQENRWVRITGDGRSNKEPDWVPVEQEK